jgi:hypothetical protein
MENSIQDIIEIFQTGHYRNIPVLGWQGANGESIDSIIEALNSYTKKNAELVIVGFGYAYNTQNFTVLNQREWGLLFEKLQTVQSAFCIKDASPSADFSTDLTSLTLRKFIGGKKSAVLFIVNDNVDLTKYWGRGMYSSQNFNIFNKKLLPACTSEIRPNIVLVDNVTESLDIVSLIMKLNHYQLKAGRLLSRL